jgi:hypothetical protein
MDFRTLLAKHENNKKRQNNYFICQVKIIRKQIKKLSIRKLKG